ncbi:MAG: hypothetical protein OXE95_01845 [Chloroflexi bacterium]|nr:hypothetical protein [Chloroflexota bacterium]MCY4246304.1 hypothetical protein [Chloroflexota bacterium]
MPNPVFAFACIIATMYGLAFYVLTGGDARRLVLFVVTSWVGFLLGQYIGGSIQSDILRIGTIYLLPATFGAFALLVFAHLLTSRPSTPVTRR